jgi:hypothetical protein
VSWLYCLILATFLRFGHGPISQVLHYSLESVCQVQVWLEQTSKYTWCMVLGWIGRRRSGLGQPPAHPRTIYEEVLCSHFELGNEEDD